MNFQDGVSKNYKVVSKFYNLNPKINFMYFISVFSLIFLFNNPVMRVFCLCTSFFVAIFYCGLKKIRSNYKFLLIISIITICINPIFYHRGTHILFYLVNNPVTLEAVFSGISTSFLMLSIFLTFFSLNLIIDTNKFLYLFAKFLPQTTFMLNMSIRFSAYLINRAKEIGNTIKTRGISFNSGKLTNRIKSNSVILEVLTLWTLEEGLSISEGLKAKNYGEYKRSCYNTYIFKRKDFIFLVFQIISIIIIWIMAILGIFNYNYYILKPIAFNSMEIIMLIFCLLILNVPFFVEMCFYIERKFKKWS